MLNIPTVLIGAIIGVWLTGGVIKIFPASEQKMELHREGRATFFVTNPAFIYIPKMSAEPIII